MDIPFQLLPALDKEQYHALKADIALRGVMVPIEYDEAGAILDGHHRARACEELGIKEWQSIIRYDMTPEQKEEHVLKLNLARRQLTPDQKRGLAVTLRQRGWSQTRIADVIGVTKQAISIWLNLVDTIDTSGVKFLTPENSPDEQQAPVFPNKVLGKDGKLYPRKPKPRGTVAKNRRERQKAMTILADMPTEKLPDTLLDVRRLGRLQREDQATQRAQTVNGDERTGNIQLWLGDFRERGQEIANESVDLIFTDPPYSNDTLPLWNDLGVFAARVLKPNGILVAYTGAMYLPEVIMSLSATLTYHWCGTVILDGPHSRVHARNVMQGSKPVLFFVRQGFNGNVWFEDTRQSEAEQKATHDWQQSLGPALYYIAVLCPEGGVVVDPFLGGGTTGVAAKRLQRDFIGIELERAAFGAAKERIGE